MIIPIRCFSCGKPIAQDWEEYDGRVKAGESPKEVLDGLGYTRYCCRRMFISHADLTSEVMNYKRF